ncbi:MAG: hypothetical protein AB7G76_04075 [Steroidobacteraceae bacterium]
MKDRVFYLCSRGFAPVGNLAIVVAVGYAYGVGGVGDYTYALAVCGPLYFLFSFNIPLYFAVRGNAAVWRPEVLLLRMISSGSTLLVAMPLLIVDRTLVKVAAAVWVLKLGDMFFELAAASVIVRTDRSDRGRRICTMEGARVASMQIVLWVVVLVGGVDLVALLCAVGAMNLVVSALLLLRVPHWEWERPTHASFRTYARELLAGSAPMTLSAAILSLSLGLPRLLLDTQMIDSERALVGIAQIAATIFAVFCNSIWMYELPKLQAARAARDYIAIEARDRMLSLVYLATLTLAAIATALVVKANAFPLLVNPSDGPLLAFAIFVMALQHCVSPQRDILKVLGMSWREARILAVAVLCAMLSWAALRGTGRASWETTLAVMVAGSILVQWIGCSRALRSQMEEKGEV